MLLKHTLFCFYFQKTPTSYITKAKVNKFDCRMVYIARFLKTFNLNNVHTKHTLFKSLYLKITSSLTENVERMNDKKIDVSD